MKLSLSGGGEVTTTDAMGNQQKHQTVGREVNVTINSSPLYVTGVEISGIKCGKARYRARLAPNAQVVSPMNTLDSWQVVPDRNQDFERHIWDQIRRPGKFRWETMHDADRGNVIRISLDGKQRGPRTASFYNRFKACKPIELSGKPRRLAMWVYGNSSWARITFELVDAEGESWSNMGAAAEDGLEHERHGEHNVREFRWLASTLGSPTGPLPLRQLQLAAKLQLASSRRQRPGRLPVATNRAGGRATRKARVH